MSEAGPEIPVAPIPQPDWRERHGGTLRAILVGCGSVCLAFLLVASISIFVLSRDPHDRRLAEGLVLKSLEAQVSGDASLSAPDREELDAAFARFQRDWSEDRIGEADGDRLRHSMMDLSRREKLTAGDVQALARALDGFPRRAAPTRR